ncbi:MAG: radical SAM protein [Candidatus Paceibacterota bacterium]|jgi:radical SAM protein with 4Fe4S-binding SPASM domain
MLKRVLKLGRQQLWLVQREYLRKEHKLKWLLWECTLNCNFFCKHCESRSGGKSCSNIVNTDEIKKAFFDIAQNFQANEIMIGVTGGEPLLRKDLFDVMKYASNLGFNWGMVSNGSLVSEETISKAKKAKMKTIDISIDGIGSVHDEFRNMKGAYEKAINAVKLFVKADFLSLVRVVTTVHSKNVNRLEEIYEEICNLGIRHWKLSNVDPSGRADCNPNIFLKKDQFIKFLSFAKKKRQEDSKLRINLGCSHYLNDEFEEEVRDRFFYCATGINIGSILYNGDIFVCPNVPRKKYLIQGNIKRDSFSEVWNNKFAIYRDKNRTTCEKCKKCDHWDKCLGGSFHTWDFEKKQPRICFMEENLYLK